jgi:hypothetical protein
VGVGYFVGHCCLQKGQQLSIASQTEAQQVSSPKKYTRLIWTKIQPKKSAISTRRSRSTQWSKEGIETYSDENPAEGNAPRASNMQLLEPPSQVPQQARETSWRKCAT